MKSQRGSLQKIFDNRVRLLVMSALAVNDALEFTALRNLLQVTDGNLAAHITALEKRGYVKVVKAFVGKKPQTTYRITERGRKALEEHLDALETMITEFRRVKT